MSTHIGFCLRDGTPVFRFWRSLTGSVFKRSEAANTTTHELFIDQVGKVLVGVAPTLPGGSCETLQPAS